MNSRIIHINEPELQFGFDQNTVDPRDGLVLFGPHQPLHPHTLRAGVIGPKDLIEEYPRYVAQMNRPIISTKRTYHGVVSMEVGRPSFPGFETVFKVKWPEKPEVQLEISPLLIETSLKNKNRTVRTNELADLYLSKIVEFTAKEDTQLDIWFLLVPFSIYRACKPQSWGRSFGSGTKKYMALAKAGQMSVGFAEYQDYDDTLSRILDTTSDFHNLLKARLIQEKIKVPVQLVLDRTLQFKNKDTNVKYDEYLKANVAWTQSTTLYYKLGKLPWKLADIREGVCYIGLVFKNITQNNQKNNVCSAAQMFLKDGDGSVFRGNIGLWESERPNVYHLDAIAAEELIGMALDDYMEKWSRYPNELFIHSKTYFNDAEWSGFQQAAEKRKAPTVLSGIMIKDLNELKLYREAKNQESNYGVLRGTALIVDDKEAYLCTKGFIPRLNTSNSIEMPRNLRIKIIRGNTDIEVVLRDILALTKLNYNSSIYGDGIPVTLKFSNRIGSILTSTTDWKVDTRQFMYYI